MKFNNFNIEPHIAECPNIDMVVSFRRINRVMPEQLGIKLRPLEEQISQEVDISHASGKKITADIGGRREPGFKRLLITSLSVKGAKCVVVRQKN